MTRARLLSGAVSAALGMMWLGMAGVGMVMGLTALAVFLLARLDRRSRK